MAFPHSMTSAQAIRGMMIPLLITATLFPAIYQPFLDRAWETLRQTSVYNWSTFETIWTVLCYAAIEVPMTVTFMNHPEWRLLRAPKPARPVSGEESTRLKPRGMRRPSRRLGEFLIYVAPLLAMDLTMIKKFSGVPLADMLESGNYDTRPASGHTTGINNTTSSLLPVRKTFLVPTLHNFSPSSPLQVIRALPAESPSSRRLTLELMASFLIYDALFFLFHLALHVVPVLRRWHAPHHSHDAQMHPQITNQLSVFERLGLVMLANLSLNAIGAHVLTRTLFVPLFVWLLVEIHSGMDLPWGYEKVLPRGWGGGARKHMRHHNAGDRGFEPFFCWWDGLWEMATSRGQGVMERLQT